MINKIGTFKDYNDGILKTVFDVGDNKIIEMSYYLIRMIKM